MNDADAGKRVALERMRRSTRIRLAFTAFVLGALAGGGIVHGLAALSPRPLVAVDGYPPEILSATPPEGAFLREGNVTFAVTFDEMLAGLPIAALEGSVTIQIDDAIVDGTRWRGTVAVSSGADGAYVLRLYGVSDRAGNRADAALEYSVDTTLPSAQAFVTSNATNLPFDVTWESSDAGSGVAQVELWLREDLGTWAPLATSSSERGAHRVDLGLRRAIVDVGATAADRAGNRSPGPIPQARILYNGSPPTAALRSLGAYWVRGPANLEGIASPGTSSAELDYYFSADNATWQGPFVGNTSASLEWTFPFPLGEGHYRLYATGMNGFGDREAAHGPDGAELACGFDGIVPSSRLAPVMPYWRSSATTLGANASDDLSGVATLTLLYAYRENVGSPWSPWIAAASRADPPWTFHFDFPRGDGRYALTTRAVDRAGGMEPVPEPADTELPIGFNAQAPPGPTLAVPASVDPTSHRTNLTWTTSPPADLGGFEIHRGDSASFAIDPAPCSASATCVLEVARDAREAWLPVPAENATFWFRVVAVDEGGLRGASDARGVVFHGRGFDTPNTFAAASPLPIEQAWSERLDYEGVCVDCVDVFKVVLSSGDRLALTLAVPPSGDFRIVLYNGAIQIVARSEVAGLGAWESLALAIPSSGTYYVVVDWSNVFGPGGRNQGWYTLSVALGP